MWKICFKKAGKRVKQDRKLAEIRAVAFKLKQGLVTQVAARVTPKPKGTFNKLTLFFFWCFSGFLDSEKFHYFQSGEIALQVVKIS